jgi:putative flippase GtrA
MVSADSVRHVPGQADGAVFHRQGMAQLLRFACVGVVSTAVFALLYLALRGAGMPAQAANAICQLVTALANTAANRRVTFGIRGREHAVRHQLQGLIAFGAGLALTSAALVALHELSPAPGRVLEVSVVVAATILATLVRFVLYRSWVFRASVRRS